MLEVSQKVSSGERDPSVDSTPQVSLNKPTLSIDPLNSINPTQGSELFLCRKSVLCRAQRITCQFHSRMFSFTNVL